MPAPLLAATAAYALALRALRRVDPELRWDWRTIDAADLAFARAFPENFLWGVATSAHQVEGGCDNNQWSRWERSRGPDGAPRIKHGDVSGAACEHWARYPEDIARMRALGVDAYRFSVEWSKIEPREGDYNDAAIAHYHAVIDALIDAGIEPVITLHHFTHPQWFDDRGGFERAVNIDHIVRFSERMFREYGGKVRRWCTINEPSVVAMVGYFLGDFPPGVRSPKRAVRVLENLLRAHGRIYRALKALPGGDAAAIGLVKNITHTDPLRPWHLADAAAAAVFTEAFNRAPLRALRTGRFTLKIPGARVDRPMEEVRGSLDFIGLNYYSHVLVKTQLDRREPFTWGYRPGDVPTDMPYGIYPEGIYRALRQVGGFGVPIYITENGIADARDDRRADFIRRYLYAVARAIIDGVDVRGFFYWSLLDNFEWAEGWSMKFGLYALDPKTQARTLRPGAEAFAAIIRASRTGTRSSDG
ncbi:MAG: glycoside hydrolase family 1 protein [Myxococcales bacterium]|nr:glycoside hydrolase family 1 protein [Myxococcales bacterium]